MSSRPYHCQTSWTGDVAQHRFNARNFQEGWTSGLNRIKHIKPGDWSSQPFQTDLGHGPDSHLKHAPKHIQISKAMAKAEIHFTSSIFFFFTKLFLLAPQWRGNLSKVPVTQCLRCYVDGSMDCFAPKLISCIFKIKVEKVLTGFILVFFFLFFSFYTVKPAILTRGCRPQPV